MASVKNAQHATAYPACDLVLCLLMKKTTTQLSFYLLVDEDSMILSTKELQWDGYEFMLTRPAPASFLQFLSRNVTASSNLFRKQRSVCAESQLCKAPVICIGNGRGGAPKKKKKRKKNVRGWKIYKPLLADGEEAREEGGGRDVGVRLLKRSKMTGNYISNYRREQERTPWLGRCGGKCIKSSTQSAGRGSFYNDPRASSRSKVLHAGEYGRQATPFLFWISVGNLQENGFQK